MLSPLAISELETEINGWHRFNYANTFDCGLHTVCDNVDRIDARFVSIEEFRERYEKTYTPCVIANDQLEWPATKKWSTHVSLYLTGTSCNKMDTTSLHYLTTHTCL